jgi:signal transduction histidine kinase
VCQLLIAGLLSGGTPGLAQTIRFTAFKATNEVSDSTYDVRRPILLNDKETHIIVGFADSADATNARYAYRLIGLDSRWHENGNLTAVNYINLIGGDYELQVRNLNFPATTATLSFRLDEAFWQRPWFIPMLAAYGLLVVGTILYVVRTYRLQNQLRLQQLRNDIAADLHDDVGTALSSITFLGEMARSRFDKKPEDVRPILERIMTESREMMQTMRGVVWMIDPQNDKAVDFFDKVKTFAGSVLDSRKIDLTFWVINGEHQLIGLAAQRNLFLIIKEAVVNIAKHSRATEAMITVKLEKEYVWVQIKDNGAGFDTELPTDGNGLRNLKNRTIQLGGELEIKSTSGAGTQINMVVPIT